MCVSGSNTSAATRTVGAAQIAQIRRSFALWRRNSKFSPFVFRVTTQKERFPYVILLFVFDVSYLSGSSILPLLPFAFFNFCCHVLS